MDILKLFIVFCVIILVMWLKKPISIAVLAATVVTILIYRLPIATACSAMIKGATSWTTIEALLVFYSITFLQRMLEKRQNLHNCQVALGCSTTAASTLPSRHSCWDAFRLPVQF